MRTRAFLVAVFAVGCIDFDAFDSRAPVQSCPFPDVNATPQRTGKLGDACMTDAECQSAECNEIARRCVVDANRLVWRAEPAAGGPTDRDGVSALAFEDAIYVMGGAKGQLQSFTDIYRYDLRTRVWEHMPMELQGARDEAVSGVASVVTPDGVVYAAGGHNRIGGIFAFVDAIDLRARTSTALAPMRLSRAGFALVHVENRLYAIGGFSDDMPAVTEAFDIATKSWSDATSVFALEPARGAFASATLEDKTYLISGEANGAGVTPTVVYNELGASPSHGWVGGVGVPVGRKWATAAAGGDRRIWLLGGETTDTARAFDPRSQLWSQVTPLTLQGLYPTLVSAPDGRLFVFGSDNKPEMIVKMLGPELAPIDPVHTCDQITVNGEFFPPNSDVDLYIDERYLATGVSDAYGKIAIAVQVPNTDAKTYALAALDAKSEYRVTTRLIVE